MAKKIAAKKLVKKSVPAKRTAKKETTLPQSLVESLNNPQDIPVKSRNHIVRVENEFKEFLKQTVLGRSYVIPKGYGGVARRLRPTSTIPYKLSHRKATNTWFLIRKA